MTRIALGCFEEQPDGSWICRRDTTIEGHGVTVSVRRHQHFLPGTAFAGFDDFTAYLVSVSELHPRRAPHEW